jgi:Flp pilus assembly pilin Flp
VATLLPPPKPTQPVTEIFMELKQSHIWQDEAGQALVEYSFIVAMVAVVCFAALQFIGGDVSAVFQQVANGFPGV